MQKSKPNYFHRKPKISLPRTNHRIRSLDVQVISTSGENLGILPIKKAIEIAKGDGLDLIEISPNTNPPVCKIMDMGKFKYDMQKKASKAKKNQKTAALKELKLRPGTEIHDYNFKIKNAKKFLSKGDKVKFTVRFKGREMQFTQQGRDLMNRIIEDTKDLGKVELSPKFEGRQMIMIIQPN
ncbi:MAG: translation initiation factor IF-3 [Candidatus Marinimicrobia bacterium]|nr:translation initiation factor IF-3 [Candidatus Neomarinimicrobiota bacterium]